MLGLLVTWQAQVVMGAVGARGLQLHTQLLTTCALARLAAAQHSMQGAELVSVLHSLQYA